MIGGVADQDGSEGQAELEALRLEIDVLDEQLLTVLAERFKVTRQVGALKAQLGLPPQDATREAQIDAKVRRLADEHHLSEAMVSEVLRAVIDRVVEEHRNQR
jgi:chorismate mutase